jgi:hypothetical protein
MTSSTGASTASARSGAASTTVASTGVDTGARRRAGAFFRACGCAFRGFGFVRAALCRAGCRLGTVFDVFFFFFTLVSGKTVQWWVMRWWEKPSRSAAYQKTGGGRAPYRRSPRAMLSTP